MRWLAVVLALLALAAGIAEEACWRDPLRGCALEGLPAERLRTEAAQDALLERASDLLGQHDVRRAWGLPGRDAGAEGWMPAGAILVAMSSYMRSTHAAPSPGTRVPAVYPPSALNLSGLSGGGSGGRGKTVWDVGDAVAHGVVSVDAVQATGWCDVVRVSLRVHRLASVTIRIPEGLAVEPLAWSHQRLLALLAHTVVLGAGESRTVELPSVCVNGRGFDPQGDAWQLTPFVWRVPAVTAVDWGGGDGNA